MEKKKMCPAIGHPKWLDYCHTIRKSKHCKYHDITNKYCEVILRKPKPVMVELKAWAQIIYMPSLKRKIVCAVRGWPYKKGNVCDTPCTIMIDKKHLKAKGGK